jgi:hypothetical protein
MPTFFCPSCFAEIDAVTAMCPQCGADVQAYRDHSYRQRLLHALKHPLSDIRMTAIEALGRLRPPGTAKALVDCALEHPCDPVQGVAILRALDLLPRDPDWARAVSRLVAHPVAAVGRGAQALLDERSKRADAASLAPDQLRTLIDDYAGHARTSEQLARLGRAALAPLCGYLAEGPQVNPHGRVFAVAMLARLPGDEVVCGLRDVLHANRLHELSAQLRESEYVVKDAVVTHLSARDYPQRDDDIAFAVRSERLPAAIMAAGRLGLSELASDLAHLFDDDVLAQVASAALIAMGHAGQQAIVATLPELLIAESSQVRARLALVRSLLTLWELGAALPPSLAARGEGRHDAVAAACALFRSASADPARTLMRGAVSGYPRLADACRGRLLQPDYEPWLHDAIDSVVREPCTQDIYGNRHTLSFEARRWMSSAAHRAGY